MQRPQQTPYRLARPRPTSPCPPRKTSPSASLTTKASGSSSTSTPRTRPLAAPSKPTTSSADIAKYDAPPNAVVLGVSPRHRRGPQDLVLEGHLQLQASWPTPTTKSSTPTVSQSKNYGVAKFANRETFLISPDGKVVKVWDVKTSRTTAPKCWPKSPPTKSKETGRNGT